MSQIITDEIKKYIKQSVLCWLATASKDGRPNVSPKEVFSSYEDRFIIIANIASPGSARNIQTNNQVCISFVDILVQKGFQLKGEAQVIRKDDPDFKKLHDILFDIAGPDYPFSSIFKIEIKSSKPIIAPRYLLFPETEEIDQISSALKLYGIEPDQ